MVTYVRVTFSQNFSLVDFELFGLTCTGAVGQCPAKSHTRAIRESIYWQRRPLSLRRRACSTTHLLARFTSVNTAWSPESDDPSEMTAKATFFCFRIDLTQPLT